jgi:hypothetical protein
MGLGSNSMTVEQRGDLFRCALVTLPDGHEVKRRINAIVDKMRKRPEDVVDDVFDAEVEATAMAAWQAIEGQKEAAGREGARNIEEYRRARLGRMERFLSLGSIAKNELDALKNEFKEAHERNPGLRAWVYINELPKPSGPGSLQFQELANRAVWALARVGGDDAWKHWVDVLIGYLLENDQDEEYLQKSGAGHLDRPAETSWESHPGVIIEGENYEIRQVFTASEHCCSWLARSAGGEQGGDAAAQAGDASVVEPPACVAQGAAKSATQARDWGDIEISFLSDERVQITVGTHTETRNYAEMGFASKLNGKPVLAWETLRAMAQAGGFTRVASNGRKWADVEKRMQEIRKVLRQQFGLSADPLLFTRRRRDSDGGYRTKFKLGRGRSCDF